MKNVKRILLSLLVVCLLCTTLTGCQVLEEARAAQGFWVTPGESFRWGDATYQRLPDGKVLEYLHVQYDYAADSVCVTEEDVPVLLSFILGEEFYQSNEGLLLVSSSYDYEAYYCRSDAYAQLVQQLQNGFNPVGICCEYTLWDTEQEDFTQTAFRLTMEQTTMIRALLALERTYVPEMMYTSYDYSLSLNECSDDMLLQKPLVELCQAGDSYFLMNTDDDGEWIISVPDAYLDEVKALLAPEVQSYEQYEEYMDEWADWDTDEDYEL